MTTTPRAFDPQAMYRLGYLLHRADHDLDTSPDCAPAMELQAVEVHSRMNEGYLDIFGPNSEAAAADLGWPSAAALQRFVEHGTWGDPN